MRKVWANLCVLAGCVAISAHALDLTQIQTLKPGQVVSIPQTGQAGTFQDWSVEHVNTYVEADGNWYELQVRNKAGEQQHVFLTLDGKAVDGDMTVKSMTLDELGTNPDQLDKFAEHEKGKVFVEGVPFPYDDSGEAILQRDGDANAKETVSYIDFVSKKDEDDGVQILGYEDDTYKAWLTHSVDVSAMTIKP